MTETEYEELVALLCQLLVLAGVPDLVAAKTFADYVYVLPASS